MKTFVFAIGGTGARVLKAMTMLMAMDMEINEIIPIIIDMDVRNGDVKRTLTALDTYRYLSQNAYADSFERGFFKNKCGTLGSVIKKGGGGAHAGVKDSFQLDFGDVNQSFYDYYKGNQLSTLTNDFLKSLFNDSDTTSPDSELHLKLNLGFQGNPNIGSVIFNNLINTPEFKHFENVFNQGDRIFIISSIFGGTGASGFPQLVNNIRNSNNTFIRESIIGSLIVQPYFRVKNDKSSSIDSDTFASKTKSALSYYTKEIDGKLNSIYYIGDKPGAAIKNVIGAENQKNNAHIVELIGAHALIDFVNKEDHNFTRSGGDYYNYGLKDIDKNVELRKLDFKDFYDIEIWKVFGKFSLAAKFFLEGIPERSKEDFYINQGMKENLKKEFFIRLEEFFNMFWSWLVEMESNERAFSPFILKGPFSKFIKDLNINSFDKKIFSDYLTKLMNKKLKEVQGDGGFSNQELFLRMLYLGIDEAFNEKVDELPSR